MSNIKRCKYMKKLTQEEFICRCRKIHNDKYDYSKSIYVNSRHLINIICPEHGEFWQLASSHLHGQGCPKCGAIIRCNKNRSSKEELLQRFREVHGDIYEYEFVEWTTQNDEIRIFCKNHEYWFSQRIVHHLNGHGCPLCKGGRKFTTNEFIIRAKEVHGDLYDYSKVTYIGKDSPVEIICSKHGSFFQTPHNHINGNGCPKCKATKMQYKIYTFLQEAFPNECWEWECSPTWLNSQRFDIYNKRCNLAIEYNGKQHYIPLEIFGGESEFEKRVTLDKTKVKLCKDNDCKLYVIKYDNVDFNKIKEDLTIILNSQNYENN